MFDDESTHYLVRAVDLGPAPATESVLPIGDRQQLMIHSVVFECGRHQLRLFKRHIRIRRAVNQKGGRELLADIAEWLEGTNLFRNGVAFEATDFLRPDSLLSIVEIDRCSISLAVASVRNHGAVGLHLGFSTRDLSPVVPWMRTRAGVPIADQIAVSVEGN